MYLASLMRNDEKKVVFGCSISRSAWKFGIMYGCVRYVLRVARVDSGCTIFSFSKIKPQIRVLLYTYMFDRAFVIFSSFCFSTAAAAAAVGGAASFCTYTKFSFSFSV